MTTPPKRAGPEAYEEENGKMSNWRPVPDPSIMTTQQLMREVNNLRDLVFTRLDAADKATALLQTKADRSPTLGELSEKLEAFKIHVQEMDKRYAAEFIKIGTIGTMMTEQQALALAATKESTTLAMSASEKAVAKAEMSAEKRFEAVNEFRSQLADQQATFARSDLVNQRTEALEKKIDEVSRGFEARLSDSKDRLTIIEGRGQAYSQGFGWIATGVGILAAIAGAFAALFLKS